MAARAIAGRLHFGLEEALFREIAGARRSGDLSPLYVLVGSNLLGMYLRRKAARGVGGIFNVRFLTFADIALLICAETGGGIPAPLPRLAGRAILADLISSSALPESLEGAAVMQGFSEALLSTFTDLSEGGCTAEIAARLIESGNTRSRLGDRAVGVLKLYAGFRKRVEMTGGDIDSLLAEAAVRAPSWKTGGRVFAYGFYDFNEQQRRLLGSLAEGPGLTLFSPTVEGEGGGFAEGNIEKLRDMGFEVVHSGEAGREDRNGTVLISAPGEEEEVREIAEGILLSVRDGGLRFGEIAVLVPSAELYLPLVREIFDEAGIPHFGREGMADSSARGVLNLVRLLGGGIERRDLVEFVMSSPLKVPADYAGGPDLMGLWVRRSADSGMTGGTGWRVECRGLAEKLDRAHRRGEEGEEAVAAARLAAELVSKLQEASGLLEELPSWSSGAGVLTALVEDIFVPSDSTKCCCGLLEGLGRLDGVSGVPSLAAFSSIAESALIDSTGYRGNLGAAGVNVLTMGQARGLSFRAVFIPGLSERIFPSVVRQDPFLLDGEREMLRRMSHGAVSLSRKSERLEEEALIFRLAVQSAGERVVCSYPRSEAGTGKERIPSSLLGLLNGYSMEGKHGAGIIFRRTVRREREPARLPVSAAEYDLFRAAERRGGKGFLPTGLFFSRGMRLIESRWGERRFTPYDGVFSSEAALKELGLVLEESGWRFSPTSLEKYAACPFAYLLSKVLKVEPVEEPERLVSITPPQRGRLVHLIIARVFSELSKAHLLPLAAVQREKASALAARIVNETLVDFQEAEPTGLAVFWEVEKKSIAEAVRLLLRAERAEEGGYVPAYFEAAFGGGGDSVRVPFEAGARTLYFHGRIDRIDQREDGGFRVVDYKTGRLTGRDQDMGGGTNLQLPVYLVAASRMLDRDVSGGDAVYRRVGKGGGRREVRFSGSSWSEDGPELERIIGAIVSCLEKGLFFAAGDGEYCRYCDVRPACPSGVVRLFEMKSLNDERFEAYREMRESGRQPI